MAVTITRTPWIDDDGTGTTGTVINNAVKTALYNDIDGALAKLPQLAGGNTFNGNQTVAGALTVNGAGFFNAAATGSQVVQVQNTLAGTGNAAVINVGNDTAANLMILQVLSSTFTASGFNLPNSASVFSSGAGGLGLGAIAGAGAIRFYSGGGVERMRILPTGEVLINATTNLSNGLLVVISDLTQRNGFNFTNSSPTTGGYFAAFFNNAAGLAGGIQHTGASSVAFQTTSDARLKDDAGRATDVAALRAVVVHDFTWKADGRADRGVFAQDAHAVFPRAVSVGTDETTEGGDLARPWMTDYSKFVPDLIVGWQQHDADLAALRAQLATLKGSH
jgi:hypothetical protein